MVDEEVFRHKLLVDGDGLGDDRRITTLMKTFVKWCISDDEEESKIVQERMLAVIAQCESTMMKSRLTSFMNAEEMKNLEKLCIGIEDSISSTHHRIKICKEELLNAKEIRKNRQEYDIIATVIQRHPERKQTSLKLKQLDKELMELFQRNNIQECKLNLRQKQFSVLQNSIYELQLLLEGEDNTIDMPDIEAD